MNTYKQILLIILTLLIIVSALSIFTTGSISGAVLAPLAIVMGPYMGITYPFSITLKTTYIATLIFSLTAMVCGFREINHTKRLIFLSTGIVMWFLAGMAGLSTGT